MDQVQQRERRFKQRFAVQLSVLVTDPETGHDLEGVTRDVSANGISFNVDEWPYTRCMISFRLTFPCEVTQLECGHAVCSGTVMRIERRAQGEATIAASIDNYQLGCYRSAFRGSDYVALVLPQMRDQRPCRPPGVRHFICRRVP